MGITIHLSEKQFLNMLPFKTALSMIQQSGGFRKFVAGEEPFETAQGREQAAHAGRMGTEAAASSGMSGVIVAVIGVAMVAVLAVAIFITKRQGLLGCENDKEAQFEDQTQEQATNEGETKEEEAIGAHTEEKIDLEDNTNPFEDNSAPTEAV